jgi:hypothetical protein
MAPSQDQPAYRPVGQAIRPAVSGLAAALILAGKSKAGRLLADLNRLAATLSTLISLILISLILISLILISGSTAVWAASAKPQVAKRLALVVGNSAYNGGLPTLDNPANDARGIAEVLASDGFEIYGGRPVVDGDKQTMEAAIRGFGRKLREYSVGLFYYAGHAVQIDGINYMIPIDAKIETRADVKWELQTVDDVLDEMQNAGNKLNILILDACRNNPLGKRGLRGYAGGLTEMSAPSGTFISYAAAPGQMAEDGAGDHSPYTLALLETLKEPGLEVWPMFNKVANRVKSETNGRQLPWISNSPISDDFYITEPVEPAAPTTATLQFEVVPTEALMRLDGQSVGPANGFNKQVAPGEHVIDITAEGYETRHEVVTLATGAEKSMIVALGRLATPAPPPLPPRTTGTLDLNVATPAARLKLDGKEMGPANGFRQELPAGTHAVEIAADGYKTQKQNVSVKPGDERSLFFELAPVAVVPPPPPPRTTGILELDVPTPGANLSLDGKPMGLANGFRRELPEGKHEIEISAKGFESSKQTVTVVAGGEKIVVVPLVAMQSLAPPSPEEQAVPGKSTGWLVVTVQPQSASITIDDAGGASAGNVRREVTPGDHVITAVGQGLVQQRVNVHVEPGETVRVPLQLAHAAAPVHRNIGRPAVPRGPASPQFSERPPEVRPPTPVAAAPPTPAPPPPTPRAQPAPP